MGLVVSEDLLFFPNYKPMGVTDTQGVTRGLILVSMLHIYGFREEHFLSVSHKCMGAINP